MIGRSAQAWYTAVIITACLGPCATFTAAQTRFVVPDTTVDFSRYGTVEECLAATARVAKGIEERERRVLWRDTIPWDPNEVVEALPDPVIKAAQQCSARFAAVEAVSLGDFSLVLSLYLKAGWDEQADALVRRRLATISGTGRERTAVIDSVVELYLNAQPKRVRRVEALLEDRLRPGSSPAARLETYFVLKHAYENVFDTTRARRFEKQLLAFIEGLSVTERQQMRSDLEKLNLLGLAEGLMAELELMSDDASLDSLRRGTAAFVALKRAHWTRIRGDSPDSIRFRIGTRAPTLDGNFWFGTEPGRTRPTRGRVALVVSYDHASCNYLGPDVNSLVERNECWITPAILRRLAARFPALEITLVGRTSGWFMYMPPVVPTDEARLIQQWLNAHQVPGAYTVTTTQFRRLPDPERRRIDRFLPGHLLESDRAVLIDEAGLIIHHAEHGLDRRNEPQFAELIEILLTRR